MADTEEPGESAPPKKSKLPIILGLVMALAGAGGGFYAVYSGLLLGGESAETHASDTTQMMAFDTQDISFVPIEPLVISLNGATKQHLRFRAQLEVATAQKDEVEKLLPRVVDVLNSYLRAVSIEDIQSNSSLVRLRAQMLRRIQVITGGNRVNDLLIMEFVLN